MADKAEASPRLDYMRKKPSRRRVYLGWNVAPNKIVLVHLMIVSTHFGLASKLLLRNLKRGEIMGHPTISASNENQSASLRNAKLFRNHRQLAGSNLACTATHQRVTVWSALRLRRFALFPSSILLCALLGCSQRQNLCAPPYGKHRHETRY